MVRGLWQGGGRGRGRWRGSVQRGEPALGFGLSRGVDGRGLKRGEGCVQHGEHDHTLSLPGDWGPFLGGFCLFIISQKQMIEVQTPKCRYPNIPKEKGAPRWK